MKSVVSAGKGIAWPSMLKKLKLLILIIKYYNKHNIASMQTVLILAILFILVALLFCKFYKFYKNNLTRPLQIYYISANDNLIGNHINIITHFGHICNIGNNDTMMISFADIIISDTSLDNSNLYFLNNTKPILCLNKCISEITYFNNIRKFIVDCRLQNKLKKRTILFVRTPLKKKIHILNYLECTHNFIGISSNYIQSIENKKKYGYSNFIIDVHSIESIPADLICTIDMVLIFQTTESPISRQYMDFLQDQFTVPVIKLDGNEDTRNLVDIISTLIKIHFFRSA